MSTYHHQPVMLREVLEFLQVERGGIFVDCTTGEGGHSEGILKKLPPDGVLICIDRDEEMLKVAKERLGGDARVKFLRGNFSQITSLLGGLGVEEVDGVLFDLGVSYAQINLPQRGFSFRQDGPLDMRMDKSQPLTAHMLVNRLSEKELEELFRKYGEEKFARRIASAIVKRRREREITSTLELAGIIRQVVKGRSHIHPATRVFMALRIAVNKELEELESALPQAIALLKKEGRIVVLSYHSLEDRITKRSFRLHKDVLNILTPKPLRPSKEEVAVNPKARSARLRAGERRDC